MARPIILGIVGDSAAGKTTISKGLVEILGPDNVTHIGTDDYHCYDRAERAEREITPLNPDCNYIDIMSQHVRHLRDGEPILKPVYNHGDGTFGRPEYVLPKRFAVIEGLLGYYTSELCDAHDVRVFLDPPEELRREWKIKRDTSKRGYSEEQVLAELDKREPDSAAFIRPQKRHADIVVSFQPGEDSEKLDAEVTLSDGLPHPDMSVLLEEGGDHGITLSEERSGDRRLFIPGDLDPEVGAAIEEGIWEKMHFAQQLRSERLGEFTVGDEKHRSESLALVQVLILYHLVTAKATIAVGGDEASGRTDDPSPAPNAAAPAA
ncbi:MAG: phosphoribulokinase [Actinobacteria bacterium]|nr:phosphoribulokinase [Actinomycetota bacterium]